MPFPADPGGVMQSSTAVTASQFRGQCVDAEEDDHRTTTVPDDDDCVRSMPRSSKGGDCRKAKQKKNTKEELQQLPSKHEDTLHRGSVASKAVQTEDSQMKELLSAEQDRCIGRGCQASGRATPATTSSARQR